MQAPRTRDATLVLRVWQEPHDAVIRARLTWVGDESELTAFGTDEILAAVAEALHRFAEGTTAS